MMVWDVFYYNISILFEIIVTSNKKVFKLFALKVTGLKNITRSQSEGSENYHTYGWVWLRLM